MDYKHISVLLNETIENLNVTEGKVYVDATLGGGGHSYEILKKLNNTGTLICFDQDIWAIDNAKKRFSEYENVVFIHDNFVNLKDRLSEIGIEKIDGIIFDLGVSSMQIDHEDRGFSYINDGPLDMRMNQSAPIDATKIVNTYPVSQLIKIFDKYGEEKNSKRIAHAIVKSRDDNSIVTTKQLTDIILDAIPKKDFYNAKSHPAKRVFQALRIEVNKELDVFEDSLNDVIDILNPKGRICVITFHSLEDRICKYRYKEVSEISNDFKSLPVVPKEYLPKFKIVNKKPILASEEELKSNDRSHSAKLRVLERVNE